MGISPEAPIAEGGPGIGDTHGVCPQFQGEPTGLVPQGAGRDPHASSKPHKLMFTARGERFALPLDFFLPNLILAVVGFFALFRRLQLGRRGHGLAQFLPERLLSPVDLMGHRTMISASPAAGSNRATVLWPVSHPPVSPGLTTRVFFCLRTSGLWVWP